MNHSNRIARVARPGWLVALAVLLAAAAALPGVARAQITCPTTTGVQESVCNIGQPRTDADDFSFYDDHRSGQEAFSFTTGTTDTLYTLDSVSIYYNVSENGTNVLAIHTQESGVPSATPINDADGNPTALTTTDSGSGLRTFTSSSAITLLGSTTYYIVPTTTDIPGTNGRYRGTTATTHTGSNGWSINGRQMRSGSSWGTDILNPAQFAVVATPDIGDNVLLRATADKVDVTEGTDAGLSFTLSIEGGNTFTAQQEITVRLAADSVIHYIPSSSRAQTATFAADSTASQTVTFPIADDEIDLGGLTVTSVVAPGDGYIVLANASVNIIDDEFVEYTGCASTSGTQEQLCSLADTGSGSVPVHTTASVTQAFTTGQTGGDNAEYTVNSVRVHLDEIDDDIDDLRLSIRPRDGSTSTLVGEAIGTLTLNGALREGINEYTASGVKLDTGTQYQLVFEETGQGGYRVRRTSATTAASASADWSIGRRAFSNNGGAFEFATESTRPHTLYIDIVATPDPPPPVTSDATLATLTLSSGTLDPVFDAATLTYAASIGHATGAVTVTATPNDRGASAAFSVVSGGGSFSGNVLTPMVGENVIAITVTAGDSVAMQTYQVTITQAAPPPPPAFCPSITSTQALACAAPGTGLDQNATIGRLGSNTHNQAVSFRVGENADGYLLRTVRLDFSGISRVGNPGRLKVAVHRAAANGAPEATELGELTPPSPLPSNGSGDFTSEDGIMLDITGTRTYALVLSVPDATGQNRYNATALSTTEAVSAGWEARNRVFRRSNNNPWFPSNGDRRIPFAVVADVVASTPTLAGVTAAPTTLTINEAGAGNSGEYTVVLNTDPQEQVTVTPGGVANTLATFNPTVLTFTSSGATIWSTAQTITVTAVDDSVDNPSDMRTGTITHAVSATSEYSALEAAAIDSVALTVTDDDAAAPTSDASLGVADFTGGITLDPEFDSEVLTYTASVANSVSSTTISTMPNSEDADAVVTYTSGGGSISGDDITLAVGANVITITVTATGGAMRVYTITITREAAETVLPVLTIAAVADATEGTDSSLDFTVTPSSAFGAETEVTVTLTGADDFVAEDGRTQILFFPANDATALTAVFGITDDAVDDTDATATATITPNAAAFTLASGGTATAMISDDDATITGACPTPTTGQVSLCKAATSNFQTQVIGRGGNGLLRAESAPFLTADDGNQFLLRRVGIPFKRVVGSPAALTVAIHDGQGTSGPGAQVGVLIGASPSTASWAEFTAPAEGIGLLPDRLYYVVLSTGITPNAANNGYELDLSTGSADATGGWSFPSSQNTYFRHDTSSWTAHGARVSFQYGIVADVRTRAPGNVVATAGPAQITVGWSAPGAPAPSGYQACVYETTGGNFDASQCNLITANNAQITASELTISQVGSTTLDPSTMYRVALRGTRAGGNGNSAWVDAGVITPQVLPNPPTNVRAYSGESSIRVEWGDPSGDNTAATSFTACAMAGSAAFPDDVASCTASATANTASARDVTITGLTNDTAYRIALRSSESTYNAVSDWVVSTPAMVTPVAVDVELSADTLDVPQGGDAIYTVTLSSAPAVPAAVAIAASAGTASITPSPSTLNFTRDDWNMAQTVTLTAADGAALSTERTFTHTASGGASGSAELLATVVAPAANNNPSDARLGSITVYSGNVANPANLLTLSPPTFSPTAATYTVTDLVDATDRSQIHIAVEMESAQVDSFEVVPLDVDTTLYDPRTSSGNEKVAPRNINLTNGIGTFNQNVPLGIVTRLHLSWESGDGSAREELVLEIPGEVPPVLTIVPLNTPTTEGGENLRFLVRTNRTFQQAQTFTVRVATDGNHIDTGLENTRQTLTFPADSIVPVQFSVALADVHASKEPTTSITLTIDDDSPAFNVIGSVLAQVFDSANEAADFAAACPRVSGVHTGICNLPFVQSDLSFGTSVGRAEFEGTQYTLQKATPFTTGSVPQGYELDSLHIAIQAAAPGTDPGDLEFAIHNEATGGGVGSRIAMLNPDDRGGILDDGVFVYHPFDTLLLTADTTYFVVASATGTMDGNHFYRVGQTRNASSDANADGWRIGLRHWEKLNTGAFTEISSGIGDTPFAMAIVADPFEPTVVAPASVTATEGDENIRVVWEPGVPDPDPAAGEIAATGFAICAVPQSAPLFPTMDDGLRDCAAQAEVRAPAVSTLLTGLVNGRNYHVAVRGTSDTFNTSDWTRSIPDVVTPQELVRLTITTEQSSATEGTDDELVFTITPDGRFGTNQAFSVTLSANARHFLADGDSGYRMATILSRTEPAMAAQTVTFAIDDDEVSEAHATATVEIVGDETRFSTSGPVMVELFDDEPTLYFPSLTSAGNAINVPDESTAIYTARLARAPVGGNVVADISVATREGTAVTDITANPTSLTFTATNYFTVQTVTLTADGLAENAVREVTHAISGGGESGEAVVTAIGIPFRANTDPADGRMREITVYHGATATDGNELALTEALDYPTTTEYTTAEAPADTTQVTVAFQTHSSVTQSFGVRVNGGARAAVDSATGGGMTTVTIPINAGSTPVQLDWTSGNGSPFTLTLNITAPSPVLTIRATQAAVTEVTGAALEFTVTPDRTFGAQTEVEVVLTGADAYIAEAARTRTLTFAAAAATAQTVSFPITYSATDDGGASAIATIATAAADEYRAPDPAASIQIADGDGEQLLAVCPLPGGAQQSVCNFGDAALADNWQVGQTEGHHYALAGPFTTGSTAGGYTLDSVVIATGAPVGDPGDLVVAIHADASGAPAATALATLAGDNPTAAGTHIYTTTAAVTLAASTQYHIVLTAPDAASGENNYPIARAASGAQTGSVNWSIADQSRRREGSGNFINRDQVQALAVVATPTSAVATPTAFTFDAVTGADPSALQTASPITIAGLGEGVQASVTVAGGSVSVNGIEPSASGLVEDGDEIVITAFPAACPGSTLAKTVTITVGGYSTTWSITRRACASNASLSGLVLSGIDFGTFATATRTYTASVDGTFASTTVSFTQAAPANERVYLTIEVDNGGNVDGNRVGLVEGVNTITITANAEDGTAQTYTVTVTRGDAPVPVLTIAALNPPVVEGTDADAEYTITPNSGFAAAQEITVTLRDADDFVAAANRVQTVTFQPSDGMNPKIVSFTVVDDMEFDPPTTAHLTITADSNTADPAFTIATNGVPIDIRDSDPIPSPCPEVSIGQERACAVSTGTEVAQRLIGERTNTVMQSVSFRTGNQASGYSLKLARFYFGRLLGNPNPLKVAVHTDSSGSPGTELGVLSGASPTGSGLHSFTSDDGIALTSATTYHLVLSEATAGVIFNSYRTFESATTQTVSTGWQASARGRESDDGGPWAAYTANTRIPFGVLADIVSPPAAMVGADCPSATATQELACNIATGGSTLTASTSTDLAQGFAPGGASTDRYTLNAVRFRVASATGSPTLSAAIHADQSGSVGALESGTLACGAIATGLVDCTATGITLSGGTTYYLVLADATADIGLAAIASTTEDGSVGWSIADQSHSNDGSGWTGSGTSAAKLMIGVVATRVVASSDATLSALSFTGGATIDPAFDADTLTYSARVASSVSTTTITATANDDGASVGIEVGGTAITGTTITLAEDTNTIDITVTAEDGTEQTYTVTIVRGDPISDLTGCATPGDMQFHVCNLGVAANGVVQVSPAGASSNSFTTGGTASDRFSVNSVRLRIDDAGDNPQHLVLSINEVASGGAPDESAGATYALTPPAAILDGVNEFTAPAGGITLNGATTYHLVASKPTGGPIQIGITDEDMETASDGWSIVQRWFYADHSSDWRMSVARDFHFGIIASPYTPSTDATLSALTLSSGTLAPAFAPSTFTYTASVANSVSSVTITPTLNHPGASVKEIQLGGTAISGTMVDLAVGANVIQVETVAEAASSTLIYQVTITRAAPSAVPQLTIAKVADVTEGTGVTLDFTITTNAAFTAEQAVTVTVPATVYIEAANRTQIATFPAGSTAAQTVSFPLRDNDNDETGGAIVIATITPNAAFTVAGTASAEIFDAGETTPPTPSADATLSALSLSGINFGAFASGTRSYTASVANGVSTTTITATPTNSGASAATTVAGGSISGDTITLAVGVNTITTTVTAVDSTTLTYTIAITRAELPALAIAAVKTPVTEGADGSLDFTITPTFAITPQIGFFARQLVTVTLTGANDYVAAANRRQTATFAAGSTAAQTVNFPIRDNTADNGGANVTATISANAAAYTRTGGGTATAEILDNDAANQPRNVRLMAGTNGTATVTWSASADTMVTGYEVCVHAGTSFSVASCAGGAVTAITGTTTFTHTRSSLTNGTAYAAGVRATYPSGTDPSVWAAADPASAIVGDDEPAGFTFGDPLTEWDPDVEATSSYIVDDINYAVPISVEGGTITVDGGAPGATVSDGQRVVVSITAGACGGASRSATVTIGASTATFTVSTRACRSNAMLGTLSLSQSGSNIALMPAFTAGSTGPFAASVRNDDDESITVTATATDMEATISHPATVNPVPGDNPISITVTAEDGTTRATYTLTIHRTAPPSSVNVQMGAEGTTVSWEEPMGADYQGYQVCFYANTGAAFDESLCTGAAVVSVTTGTEHTLNNLMEGTNYHIAVRSVGIASDDFSNWRQASADAIGTRVAAESGATIVRAFTGITNAAIGSRIAQVNAAGAGVGGISTNFADDFERTASRVILSQGTSLQEGRDMGESMKRMLDGSIIALSGGGGSGFEMPSLWLSGDYVAVGGDDEGLDWDGDVLSLQFGADARLANGMLAGAALSRSQSDIEYDYDNSSDLGQGSGDQKITLTSIHPYLGWRSDDIEMWATLAYGDGELERTPDNGDARTDDAQLFSGAFSTALAVTANFRVHADIEAARLTIDGAEDEADITADANRIRLGAQRSRTTRSGGASTRRTLEIAARHDGGDGATGVGAEVGGSIAHDNGAGTTITARARALVVHGDDYEEWGAGISLRHAPGADGQGFALKMQPSWGALTSRAEALRNGDLDELGAGGGEFIPAMLMTGEIGYGIARTSGTMTPYTGFRFAEQSRDYRVGLRYRMRLPSVTLGAEAFRNERGDAETGVRLKAGINW